MALCNVYRNSAVNYQYVDKSRKICVLPKYQDNKATITVTAENTPRLSVVCRELECWIVSFGN